MNSSFTYTRINRWYTRFNRGYTKFCLSAVTI